MKESRGYVTMERRERRPGEVRSLHRRGVEGFLVRWWRHLLICVAVVLIAVAVLPGLAQSGKTSQSNAVLNQAASAPSDSPRQTALPTAAAKVAASQPQPAPTAETVRPNAIPLAPKPAMSGPAPVRKAGSPDPSPSTNRFIVMDGASGAVLFEENAHDPIAMASLTKMMTAILGIEHGNLEDRPKIDISARSLSDSTVMGLEPGLDVTLEDLLYGLMLPSGNDAAIAIARYVGGDETAFVKLMNQKASWLGLASTHFANPHGLDASDHYSSPYDQAVIARYGMQYPTFQKLAATKSYNISRSNIAFTVQNLNPILGVYPGADGVKIGFTDNAGRSIVASATRNGHRVFVSFMKSKAGLAPDATHLLDWAFAYHTWPD